MPDRVVVGKPLPRVEDDPEGIGETAEHQQHDPLWMHRARQGLERELQVTFAIERSTLIILVENLVARPEFLLVNDAIFNHVFTPEVVAIAGYQGMIKIENCECHGLITVSRLAAFQMTMSEWVAQILNDL